MKKMLAAVVIFFMGVAFGLILTGGRLNAQSANSNSDVMSKLLLDTQWSRNKFPDASSFIDVTAS